MKNYLRCIIAVFAVVSAAFVCTAQLSPGYLDLNGVDRYMKIGKSTDFDIASDGNQTVTFNVRIDETVSQTSTYRMLCSRVRRYEGNNNNDVTGYEIYNGTNTSGYYNSASINYPSLSWIARHVEVTPGKMAADIWHHVALVINHSARTATFYLDGTAVATNSNLPQSAVPNVADILVGAGYTMSNNVKFSLSNLSGYTFADFDNVRFYSTALTAAQVAADRDSETYLADCGAIVAYDFTSFYGREVPDITGNEHTAYIEGSLDSNYSPEMLNVNVSVTGDGTVSVSDTEGGLPVEQIRYGYYAYYTATPAEGCEVGAPVAMTADGTTSTLTDYTTRADGSIAGRIFMLAPTTLTFAFTPDAFIGEIGADEADAPVVYYNLQGVRVAAENITDGIYIRVQGTKASRVYIRR